MPTLDVRGIKLRTTTKRRYVAVAVRPQDVPTDEGWYVKFAHLLKRSDNLETVRKVRYAYNGYHGSFAVVIDTTTGEEV